ncbi:YNL284C-B-like protein, partial [Saccharomyces cerevisiae FostersO]
FLCHTFQLFAPSQFLPTWVKDILSADYTDIMKILSKSINKMQSDTQEVNDITTLATLHYNGSTPADAFEAEVTNILDRLNNNGIPINNKVAWPIHYERSIWRVQIFTLRTSSIYTYDSC